MSEAQTERPYVLQHDDYYPRIYPLPRKYVNNILASDEEKWAVLADMGIERGPVDQSPLARWRDAVADQSGIPRQKLNPEHGGHMDMGFSPIDVRHFSFYLA